MSQSEIWFDLPESLELNKYNSELGYFAYAKSKILFIIFYLSDIYKIKEIVGIQ